MRIDQGGPQAVGQRRGHLDLATQRTAQQILSAQHQLVQIDRFGTQILLSREGQHLLVELGAVPRRARRCLRELHQMRIGETHLQQFEIAEDRR